MDYPIQLCYFIKELLSSFIIFLIMKKSIILLFIFLSQYAFAYADDIQLETGESLSCLFLDRTGSEIFLDCQNDGLQSYAITKVRSVNGEKVLPVDDKLLSWIKSQQSSFTQMPLSFDILDQERMDSYKRMGEPDSITGIIERLIVEEGMSVYDTAVRQIALTMIGGLQNLKSAYLPIQTYWDGHLRQLINIRAGYPSQPFIYDPFQPERVSSDLSEKGKRGFLFRIINAHGLYDSQDPLDGKERFVGFPNWPTIHWEDWKPIAGENAWVVIAAMHLHKKRYLKKPDHNPDRSLDTVEMRLAKEIARAAQLLQAPNGGIRMAPIGTYTPIVTIDKNSSLEEISQTLDALARYEPSVKEKNPVNQLFENGMVVNDQYMPEELTWYYNEISTENNLSWYTAFRMLYEVTGEERYKKSMEDIEKYFRSAWNASEYYFYQGMHFRFGTWFPNNEHFATDVQNWAVAALGPQKIDAWFGEGTAFKIWQKTKNISGNFNQQHKIRGVGFTTEHDRISIEWTVGAIFATRSLAEYYKKSHPDWAEEAAQDAQNMRSSMESFRIEISDQEAAYAYSSRRGWIPFGWFSHDPNIISLVSTCWIILADADYNPFFLPE